MSQAWLLRYRDRGDSPPDGKRVVQRDRMEVQGRAAVFFDLPSRQERHRRNILAVPIDLLLDVEQMASDLPARQTPTSAELAGGGYPSTPKPDHP